MQVERHKNAEHLNVGENTQMIHWPELEDENVIDGSFFCMLNVKMQAKPSFFAILFIAIHESCPTRFNNWHVLIIYRYINIIAHLYLLITFVATRGPPLFLCKLKPHISLD